MSDISVLVMKEGALKPVFVESGGRGSSSTYTLFAVSLL